MLFALEGWSVVNVFSPTSRTGYAWQEITFYLKMTDESLISERII